MNFLIIVSIIIFLIWGLSPAKKAKDNQKTDEESYNVGPSPVPGYDNMDDYLNDIPSSARDLVRRYIKAYDSKNEKDLKATASALINNHYRASDEKKTDECCLYEMTVTERPYTYRGFMNKFKDFSDIDIGDGMDLMEIFREQNERVYYGPNYTNLKKTKNVNNQKKDGVTDTDDVSSLISQYKKAYDSCNEKKIEVIVEKMLKEHYSLVSLHKTEKRELLEKAVESRPYKYRGNNKKGEDLFTLFWKQNKEIEKKDGYL